MSLSEYVKRDDLKGLYALPMKEASKRLGVSESSLRNICRKHNIERWPYRKFQQLDAHIASLQNVDSSQQSSQQREMIDSLLKARTILEDNPNMTCEMAILQANKHLQTNTNFQSINMEVSSSLFTATNNNMNSNNIITSPSNLSIMSGGSCNFSSPSNLVQQQQSSVNSNWVMNMNGGSYLVNSTTASTGVISRGRVRKGSVNSNLGHQQQSTLSPRQKPIRRRSFAATSPSIMIDSDEEEEEEDEVEEAEEELEVAFPNRLQSTTLIESNRVPVEKINSPIEPPVINTNLNPSSPIATVKSRSKTRHHSLIHEQHPYPQYRTQQSPNQSFTKSSPVYPRMNAYYNQQQQQQESNQAFSTGTISYGSNNVYGSISHSPTTNTISPFQLSQTIQMETDSMMVDDNMETTSNLPTKITSPTIDKLIERKVQKSRSYSSPPVVGGFIGNSNPNAINSNNNTNLLVMTSSLSIQSSPPINTNSSNTPTTPTSTDFNLNRLITNTSFENISVQQQHETNQRVLEVLRSSPVSPVFSSNFSYLSKDELFNSEAFLRRKRSDSHKSSNSNMSTSSSSSPQQRNSGTFSSNPLFQ
ncbi:hypothetical protein ABK040_004741 [Willaertia magna]